jgi:hypothetical protein
MKYTIAIIAILAFASCKKEYNCRCVDKDGGEVFTHNYKVKKSSYDATKTTCEGQAVGLTGSYPLKAPITCTLK